MCRGKCLASFPTERQLSLMVRELKANFKHKCIGLLEGVVEVLRMAQLACHYLVVVHKERP